MKATNYILSLLLLIPALNTIAQDSIVNRNVTVEREYKPVILDAGKINSIPEVLEPRVEKATAIYSNFNLPLTVDFNIHTLPPAELERNKRFEGKSGFARIGLGNYFNTMADFAFPLIKKPDMLLDISLNHLASFGNKAHSNTKGALLFDKKFNNFTLYAGIGGGHEYFKYYGDNTNKLTTINLDTLQNKVGLIKYSELNRAGKNTNSRNYYLSELANDSLTNTLWRYSAHVGFVSQESANELRYRFEMKYNGMNTGYGITEQHIRTQGGLSVANNTNRMGMDIDINYMAYNTTIPNQLNFLNAYSVFTLNPYYLIERKNWDARLGIKSSLSFLSGTLRIHPSPDVRAEWRVIPKYISIYGGAGGELKVNTMNEMYNENRYLFSEIRVDDTYTPFHLYAGIKTKPLYNLFLDAFIEHISIDNQYFFVNKEYVSTSDAGINSSIYTNRFNVFYRNASLTKIGARINYNLRNKVNVEIKALHNGWWVEDELHAWNKPKWEASMNTQIIINRNLSITSNVFFESERFAKTGTNSIRMRPKVDVNLGAAYSHNKWLNTFVKVNNLINNPYQNFYGYEVQGINILAGAAFTF